MKAEPGSFHLGVIDIFSIMLPGALLAYFLPDLLGPDVFGSLLSKPTEGVHGWAVFLFTAYLFGHIVFLMSSFLDIPYDNLIRPRCYPEIKEIAYLAADVMKEKAIGEDNAKVMKTFQWAKAMLILEHPEASSEVSRLEAASKFFRSLVVVFAILAFLNIAILLCNSGEKVNGYAVLMLLILMGLSLWRYAERRHKSVKQACWFVITMDGFERQKSASGGVDQTTTHAGGVVYRMKNDVVEYLLVRPKTNANEWLLPKGHIEQGESPAEAAVREVFEEAGVVAHIISRIGSIHFRAKDENVVAEFYLMKYVEQTSDKEDREVAWLSAKDANKCLSFANYRYLLGIAEKKKEEINLTVCAAGKRMIVHGRVLDIINGQSQAGVVVRAYRHQDRVLLGEDTTGSHGRYDIVYAPISKGSSIDLVVCAYKNGKEIAVSPVIFNADSTEVVDLAIN